MNREILFRGRVTDAWAGHEKYKGQWVVGGVVANRDGGMFICGDITNAKTGEKHRLISDVEPVTVSQYTGTDITIGNEKIAAYEGDVFKFGNSYYVVIYNTTEKKFGAVEVEEWAKYGKRFYSIDVLAIESNMLSYEGNVFDNPELLKGWTPTLKQTTFGGNF